MTTPTPYQSLLGGIGLALPVYALLTINDSVFGISGFLHRSFRGEKDAIASIGGLLAGGYAVGVLDGLAPDNHKLSIAQILVSGFSVGAGSKIANGCTSGHMICGISRLSLRSIVATAMFFVTGSITARLVHHEAPSVKELNWSSGENIGGLLILQLVPLIVCAIGFFKSNISSADQHQSSQSSFRRLISFASSFGFAAALRTSNLTDARKVTSFLLPFHRAFDPSLAFLAAGVLPFSLLLHASKRKKSEAANLRKVDTKLIIGAALFGIGWGMGGICPGPALVNLGRASYTGYGFTYHALWLTSAIVGGALL